MDTERFNWADLKPIYDAITALTGIDAINISSVELRTDGIVIHHYALNEQGHKYVLQPGHAAMLRTELHYDMVVTRTSEGLVSRPG